MLALGNANSRSLLLSVPMRICLDHSNDATVLLARVLRSTSVVTPSVDERCPPLPSCKKQVIDISSWQR
jgi:hypothetical protein